MDNSGSLCFSPLFSHSISSCFVSRDPREDFKILVVPLSQPLSHLPSPLLP